MKRLFSALLLTGVFLAPALFKGPSATPQLYSDARAAGYQAKNCQYCHLDPVAKGFNKRGQFLKNEKERRKADEVDVEWLKDYKED